MADPNAPISDNFLDSLAEEFLNSTSPLDFCFDGDLNGDIALPQLEAPQGNGGLATSAVPAVDTLADFPLPPLSATPAQTDAGLGFGFLPPFDPAAENALPQASTGNASASSGDHATAANGGARGSGSSGSGSLSTGRPPAAPQALDDADDEDYDKVTNQVMKFKEKNRAAQRRYRERQREKLLASEEKVERLQQQLEAMRLEQETLGQRNALLERLLAMQQQAAAARPKGGAGRSAIEAQKEAWWLSSQMQVYMKQALHLDGDLLFTVRKTGPVRMTQAQVAEMPHDEFDGMWREYINSFAEHLLAMDGDPESPAGRRLARLCFEGGQLKGSILMSYPDRIHAQQKRTYGNDARMGLLKGELPSDDVWARMADTAGLTALQRQAIIRLRELYLRNVGVLARRRQQLTSVLQAALPIQQNGASCDGVADSKYSSTLGTMDALRDTLRDEHSCLMQFVLTIWRRVLTAVQTAHMNVTFYPASVNMLRLAEVLARQAGELPSSAIMAQGAADSGAELLPVDVVLPRDMRSWTAPEVDLEALYPGMSFEDIRPSTPPPALRTEPAPLNSADSTTDGATGRASSGSPASGLTAADGGPAAHETGSLAPNGNQPQLPF